MAELTSEPGFTSQKNGGAEKMVDHLKTTFSSSGRVRVAGFKRPGFSGSGFSGSGLNGRPSVQNTIDQVARGLVPSVIGGHKCGLGGHKRVWMLPGRS